jgi:hypothetical protein
MILPRRKGELLVDRDVETSHQTVFQHDLDSKTLERPRKATACEMKMSRFGAVKMFLPWVSCATGTPLSCIMEGYGLVVMTGFLASPTFRNHFGCRESLESEKIYEIPLKWQVVGSFLLVFILAYNCTVGPTTDSLISELPSTRLNSKTTILARTCYLVVSTVNGIIAPIMLNPQSPNWASKIVWFWAGITSLCITYAYFCIPKPKDLIYGQINDLYVEEVPARGFKAAGQKLRTRDAVENVRATHVGEGENGQVSHPTIERTKPRKCKRRLGLIEGQD